MRFRLTIFLILANAALFFALWSLERKPDASAQSVSDSVAFTVLEISGKGIDKPRILKFENNKWRIVAPIDWPANLFAVNRIRNQIEFLDKEASFSLSEVTKHGHNLAEYGLDDPAYTFRYGNGKKMYTLKIGKSAPVGDRIYMLDQNGDKIIVVDKEFVESLVVDTERLRNHNVFDIPRFEVSAFSIRLPSAESTNSLKGNFRRVGLVRDGSKWKFETPIVANADSNEVDAFLGEICHMSAKGFSNDAAAEAGFEISALPTTITIEGTNRRQVLMLGGKTKDGTHIYARLEDNPTIFTVDASVLKSLADVQTTLRDKSIMNFDIEKINNIDISKNGKVIKFSKLKGGIWDVIGEGKDGAAITSKADTAAVSNLLLKLTKTRVRQFVSDAPGENIAPYGLSAASLKIVATQTDQTSRGLVIGNAYDNKGEKLVYARVENSDAIFGISPELAELADTDFLRYRSKIVEMLPEKAVLSSVKVSAAGSNTPIFELVSKNGDFAQALAKLQPRQRSASGRILKYAKAFAVKKYIGYDFSKDGISVEGKMIPWNYSLDFTFDVPGTASNVSETRSFVLTKRLGGLTQYGGYGKHDASFLLPEDFIDAFFSLVEDSIVSSELKKTPPAAPAKK